jgi:uncharacterized membrane protein
MKAFRRQLFTGNRRLCEELHKVLAMLAIYYAEVVAWLPVIVALVLLSFGALYPALLVLVFGEIFVAVVIYLVEERNGRNGA